MVVPPTNVGVIRARGVTTPVRATCQLTSTSSAIRKSAGYL
jgi:hypothetical protein